MEISKFQEILGELSMRKQCVPGSLSSSPALEPGNEANTTLAKSIYAKLLHRKYKLKFLKSDVHSA